MHRAARLQLMMTPCRGHRLHLGLLRELLHHSARSALLLLGHPCGLLWLGLGLLDLLSDLRPQARAQPCGQGTPGAGGQQAADLWAGQLPRAQGTRPALSCGRAAAS